MICKLLLLGDSLVLGLGTIPNAYNAGVVSSTTRQLQARLLDDISKCPSVENTVIHIGVNNLYVKEDKHREMLEDIAATTCKYSKKVYFLQSPMQKNIKAVTALNNITFGLQNDCVKWITYPRELKVHLYNDNTHLTGEGNTLWKEHILRMIRHD